jgi:hypothetical protein
MENEDGHSNQTTITFYGHKRRNLKNSEPTPRLSHFSFSFSENKK